MANDFYQHSGHPGTRAPRSSALLRAEFAAVEDGFDKLPDVGTANLFSVSDGSALVGKTAAQAKVILALENVTNTADADKPISTLTQAALDLKAPLASPALTGAPTAPTQLESDNSTKIATTAYVTRKLSSGSGYAWVAGVLIQWGSETCNATAETAKSHSFPIAFPTNIVSLVATPMSSVIFDFRVYTPTTSGFNSIVSAGGGVLFKYIAIGS